SSPIDCRSRRRLRLFPPGPAGPEVLEARGVRTASSNLGTPSQPSVGMSNPADIDWLGRTEPTKRKPETTWLGFVHLQPLVAGLDRHARHGHVRHGAIRLIRFFVHVSSDEGY